MSEQIIITLIVFVAWMAAVGAVVYSASVFYRSVKMLVEVIRYSQDAETDRQSFPGRRA